MRKTIFSFLVLLSFSFKPHAQIYPVNANAVLVPPYSVYLSDYVSGTTDRLILNVILNDVARPELRVRLRMKVEGQGVKLETKPEYIGSEIILQGGVPLRLNGTDLTEYFNLNNLNFTGISKREFEKTGALPPGYYTFCFEVLEYNRGAKISNSICAPGWLVLNDPPIVNLPKNNEKLKPTFPQNLVFQWTPRHTGSPNSAFSTEYEIQMVEVWPSNRNPNDAILTSPPILETTTRSTSFIYGPAETPLEPGRRYALRIKAKSIVGAEELDLFKNNGFSEVISFIYGDACDLPGNIQVETGSNKFKIMWDGKFNHSAYTFRYRQSGTTNWYESNTSIDEINIYSLTPNTTYEYQVSGACGMFSGQYTEIASLKTNEPGVASYSCGLPIGNFNLDPADLIPSLKAGEVIQAGDFEVKLAQVSGSNGTFSGEGVIEVPYFNKAKVKASFTNISVNKEMRMVSGYMNVTGAGVDVIPSGVMDAMDVLSQTLSALDSTLRDLESNLPQPFDPHAFVPDVVYNVPGPATVSSNPDGSVTVTDSKGVQHQIPKGTEAAIIDDSGKGYLIDSKGNVHEVSVAVATAAARREYNLKLTFSAPNSTYGFDAKRDDALAGRYDSLSAKYFVPYKAVEVGKIDNLVGTLNDASLDKSRIKFEMGGVPIPATSFNGPSSTVAVTGKIDGEQEGLIAILPAADTSQRDQVLGRANVVSYNAINKNVVIVPVNGNTYDNFGSQVSLQTELNRIYSQAVVSWSVRIAENITVPEISPFNVGETGMLSNFTDHMKKVIRAYKDNMKEKDTYFLFLVSNATDPDINGVMPRSKQAGFIFKNKHNNEKEIAHTIAHELGHGVFNLHHTFMEENFRVTKNTTNNLMDYTGGDRLYKYQWDMMRYPAFVIGAFEGDAEAAMRSNDENEIVKKLLSVNGNGFLLCRKCEEEGRELNPEKNQRYKISLDGKFFNCLIGKINSDNLELVYDIQARDEVSLHQYPITSNPLQDQFLLIGKSDGTIVPCVSTTQLPSIFCSLQELAMSDALESEILNDISQCIDQSDFSGSGVLQYSSKEAISYEAIKKAIVDQLKKEFFTNVKIGVRLHDQLGNSEFLSTPGVEDGKQELTLLIKVDEVNRVVYIKNINVSSDYLNTFISRLQNDANRRGIEVNVEELRRQVISDVESEATNKSFADHAFQSLSSFFNESVGKYVEVVQTTQKAAKNVWDEGKMAQSHWYDPHEDHNKWPEYGKVDEMTAGPLDAVIDEVTGIPMACKSLYGVMTDAKQRQAFGQLFTSEGMSGLIQALRAEIDSTLNDEEKLKYSSSKTVVSVAAMFLTGGISKTGKGISMLENLMSSMGQLAKYKKLVSYLENVKKTLRYQPEIFAKVKKQFDEVFEKFKDIDGGEIVQRLDNLISRIGVDNFNVFLEKLHRLKNIPGIEKILLDLSVDGATGWKKFIGSKFVIDYVSKKGDDFISKIASFELAQEIIIDGVTRARVYDMVADGVRYEFKNWNGFYPSTIKTQFIRDLTDPLVTNIDQIKWVFNKTDNISDLTALKGKVLLALKKVDGSPADELSKLPLDKVKQLLGSDFGVITEANKAQKFLGALDKDEFFDVIFEVAD